MPSKNDIQNEIIALKTGAQDIVRRKYLKELSNLTGRDTIIYATAFNSPRSDISGTLLSITGEDIHGFMSSLNGLKNTKLDIVLHSPGGSGDAAEQIIKYLRSKYEHIRAIVPQNAMSAATMITCACDSILMGKHSAIGPIDPQMIVSMPNGVKHVVSAQSVLDEFNMAKEEIKKDQNTIPLWLTKIQNYPPGFLTQCKTAIDSSIERVTSWLSEYMLKEDIGKASVIAKWLGDEGEHKAHGRPITRELAMKKGLVIEVLEEEQQLQEAVLSLFHATLITFEVTPCVKLIENQNGIGSYTVIQS